MDLERDLRLLGSEIAWPPTPQLAEHVAAGLAPRQSRRLPDRRVLVLAFAVLVAALAAAFAVPQSRGAILRFLHLGGVTIEFVDRLPPAQERPLGADIGPVVSPAVVERTIAGSLLLPPLDPLPPLHVERAGFVSVLFRVDDEPVQLSELGTSYGGMLKKLAIGGTRVTQVDVGGTEGLWIFGARHVFAFPLVPPRLAGNVLLWQRDGLTLRLEGSHLKLADALRVARSLRQTKM